MVIKKLENTKIKSIKKIKAKRIKIKVKRIKVKIKRVKIKVKRIKSKKILTIFQNNYSNVYYKLLQNK